METSTTLIEKWTEVFPKNREIHVELSKTGNGYFTKIIGQRLNNETNELSKRKALLTELEMHQVPFMAAFLGNDENLDPHSIIKEIPRTEADCEYFTKIFDFAIEKNRCVRICLKDYETGRQMFVKTYKRVKNEWQFCGWFDVSFRELQILLNILDQALSIVYRQRKPEVTYMGCSCDTPCFQFDG